MTIQTQTNMPKIVPLRIYYAKKVAEKDAQLFLHTKNNLIITVHGSSPHLKAIRWEVVNLHITLAKEYIQKKYDLMVYSERWMQDEKIKDAVRRIVLIDQNIQLMTTYVSGTKRLLRAGTFATFDNLKKKRSQLAEFLKSERLVDFPPIPKTDLSLQKSITQ